MQKFLWNKQSLLLYMTVENWILFGKSFIHLFCARSSMRSIHMHIEWSGNQVFRTAKTKYCQNGVGFYTRLPHTYCIDIVSICLKFCCCSRIFFNEIFIKFTEGKYLKCLANLIILVSSTLSKIFFLIFSIPERLLNDS